MSICTSKSNHNDERIGGKRQASRRVSISLTNNDENNDTSAVADTPVAKRLRFSPRNFKYCADITGLPDEYRCSGCVAFKDFGTKERDQYTTKKYACFKAWTKNADDVRPTMMSHVLAIHDFIESELHVSVEAMRVVEDAPINESPMTTATTTPSTVTPSMTTPRKRNISYETNPVHSQGQYFEFDIPATHKVVHKGYLSRLERESEILYDLRSKLQQKQYQTDSIFTQNLWSIALSAVPALALSAAQYLIPLAFWAFLHDTGVFDFKRFNRNLFAKSFPSDNTLRKYTLLTASRDTMLLGHELRDDKIYMACDKGNKKGIGHFVKHISRWIPGKVDKRLLDIDASGGTSVECAAGIQASMNKLKANADDDTHQLYGTGTDSGGGGTLESLFQEMDALGICAPEEEHLISNCGTHAVQLQLKNAVTAALGEGSLEKINAMQLLHSVYRLQESMTRDEWKHILYKSSEFVVTHDPTNISNDGLTKHKGKIAIRFLISTTQCLPFTQSSRRF